MRRDAEISMAGINDESPSVTDARAKPGLSNLHTDRTMLTWSAVDWHSLRLQPSEQLNLVWGCD